VTPRLELNFPNPVETRADLFDREPELGIVQETLRSPTRRPVVLMGERVMGKTSLLNVVVEWAAQEPGLAVLQLPHVSSREAFVEEVLDGIAAEAQTSLHRLGLRDAQGKLRLSTVTEFTRVAAELSAAAPDRAFVLCLDELDSMLVNCPDDASANQIMDLILHVVSRTGLPIKFVFTITRTAPRILRSDASPFLSAARFVLLEPWSPAEARAFATSLLPETSIFEDRAHALLFESGGGHPYLTKAVLQSLLDLNRPAGTGGPVTADDVRAAVAATVISPEVDFTLENIAKVHFTHAELSVLRRLAGRPELAGAAEWASAAELAGAAGWAGAAELAGAAEWAGAADALHELRQRRYLRVDPAGRYRPAFGLLGQWLARQPWADLPAQEPAGQPASPAGQPAAPAGAPPALLIDDDRKRVFLGGKELLLTAQEYRFLNCLAAHAGRVVDRHTITTEVWPEEVRVDGVREGRLDALVYRLREELGDAAAGYVQTRRGRGFYMNPEHVKRLSGGAP
jgi:hypothetical protein